LLKLIRPMLATLVPKPFHRKGWVYEEKYDGVGRPLGEGDLRHQLGADPGDTRFAGSRAKRRCGSPERSHLGGELGQRFL
jgi:hypothetical protein